MRSSALQPSLGAKCLLCLFALFAADIQAQRHQLNKVEPLSWWTGMQSNQLQLMLHGQNISQLTPRIQAQGLSIQQVQKLDSEHYLVIDLTLDSSLKPGTYDIEFFDGEQLVLSHPYQINSKNLNPAANRSFSPKDVIYLITPDRFANGNKQNDNQPDMQERADRHNIGGRHGGDIQGIIEHLDYLQDMGFSQIWSQPMIENNQPTYSYHGYSATDFYRIDPRFGSNQLYRELSFKAQQKGIGLIKDMVLNHIGDQHWWLTDLPSTDWLNFQGQAYTGTHHKRQSLHDPHATEKDKKLFSDGWFVPTMPDLNQRHPVLATYLIQNTLWWIEYANLSGLRVDTYSYPDRDFLAEWTRRITEEYPNINIVGEEWTTNPALVSYWQRGKQNYDGYVSYLPSLMDFPLQEAIIQSLTQEENWGSGLNQLYQTMANDFQYADPYNLVTFTDNHDMSRVFTQLNQDLALFKMALGYLFTTRGIPQVYYGTELLMTNPDTEDHGVIRSDFPGGWPADKVHARTGAGLSDDQRQAQNYVKQLLNWRKNAEVVHQGKLTHFAPKDGVYVYFRTLGEQRLMVVLNKNLGSTELQPADYAELIEEHTQAKDVLSGDQYRLTQAITLAPKSIHIWQLTP